MALKNSIPSQEIEMLIFDGLNHLKKNPKFDSSTNIHKIFFPTIHEKSKLGFILC